MGEYRCCVCNGSGIMSKGTTYERTCVHCDGRGHITTIDRVPDPTAARIAALEREVAEARAEVQMPSGWRIDTVDGITWLTHDTEDFAAAVASVDAEDIAAGAVQALRAFADLIEKGGGK